MVAMDVVRKNSSFCVPEAKVIEDVDVKWDLGLRAKTQVFVYPGGQDQDKIEV
jgi:hypothetical protein